MADAGLGAVSGELLKTALDAVRSCVNFTETLKLLVATLESLSPVIQEIEELNNKLGRPKKELELLLSTMREGNLLVLKCSDISRYNPVDRFRYERKLQKLITSLQWNLNILLPAQTFRDHKETLFYVREMHSKENATASLSSQRHLLEGGRKELLRPGAVSGAVSELLKIVSEARGYSSNGTLAHLSDTLEALQKLNNEFGFRKEGHELLLSLLVQGKQLVGGSCLIHRFNFWAKMLYERNLQLLIESLKRFITIDLQVQSAREIKETLHLVSAAASFSQTTPLLEDDLNESEIYGPTTGTWTNSSPQQEEQCQLLLPGTVNSSTNEIDVTHKKKEVIVRGGFLTVTVISAENLPAMDLRGKSDPYVVLTLRKAKSKAETIYKTKVVKRDLNPKWNQEFVFDVDDGLHDMLLVEVLDEDTYSKDDYMGTCMLSLPNVIVAMECTESFQLVGAKAKSGSLKLHLKWNPK